MSVFSYIFDLKSVVSPWELPAVAGGPVALTQLIFVSCDDIDSGAGTRYYMLRAGIGRAMLMPEPQTGPVEYKRDLLLRPRRASTAEQTRQDRFQHLTTQLLWRLRQSCPGHSAFIGGDVTFITLPEDTAIVGTQPIIARLAPGLEECQGAYYEIGVADDGALVGVTAAEMSQSIATLQWMAGSLGCVTRTTRVVDLREGQWIHEASSSDGDSATASSSDGDPATASTAATASPSDGNPISTAQAGIDGRECLFVAEVFVLPYDSIPHQGLNCPVPSSYARVRPAPLDQLRVTLTGPTGSGKSTLLGTLSTGAFDDGHGKTRPSSFRHIHEMETGLTSTVTQELVGYNGAAIRNYANKNIKGWLEIHDRAKDGRFVVMTDSAGHPRFRRTTLRGLVGWAPHWTLLCLSAVPEAPGQDHLALCLKLGLPLVLVLTKSDQVNKEALKRRLTPIWRAVKSAGRTPRLLQSRQRYAERASSSLPPNQKMPEYANYINDKDAEDISSVLSSMRESADLCATVPVILESSVTGDGVGLMHALLRDLPLPPKAVVSDFVGTVVDKAQPETLFHIEDRFNKPVSYNGSAIRWQADVECVVSGYLRFGRLAVGQIVQVGPFPVAEDAAGAGSHAEQTSTPRLATANAGPEWRAARIVSIRNLKASVSTLEVDQVGTLGLRREVSLDAGELAWTVNPRRGMVVAVPNKYMMDNKLGLEAASVLTAYFGDVGISRLSVGTEVTFYVASIRAQAKIASIESSPPIATLVGVDEGKVVAAEHTEGDMFGLEPDDGEEVNSPEQGFRVRLELLYGREWVELGSKIVLLEGACPEGAVLDGFVGQVVSTAAK